MDNPDASNFFGTVELIFTFVKGSAEHHAYFIDKQKEFNPDQVPLHLLDLTQQDMLELSCQLVVTRLE